jgi:hypothetical protein
VFGIEAAEDVEGSVELGGVRHDCLGRGKKCLYYCFTGCRKDVRSILVFRDTEGSELRCGVQSMPQCHTQFSLSSSISTRSSMIVPDDRMFRGSSEYKCIPAMLPRHSQMHTYYAKWS